MSYEDFVEGIKPATKDNAVTYEIAKGQFLKIAKGISNEVNPHILIIDEINRGNIAAIFGELITLLEESKRQGASDETWVTLTYSKEKFCLPPNLYIIGTMNTADRSVEALDTALRRRFSFIEMPPRPEILSIDIEGIDVRQLLKVINQRITALKDADHTIGHAWFIDCKTQKDVLAVMIDKVIPLLREHFYNENEKLEAVIGSQFFNSSIAEVNFLTAINGNEKGSITKRLLSREELLAKEIDLKQLY
jgi:5-methylcytosine-specific restriction protein B